MKKICLLLCLLSLSACETEPVIFGPQEDLTQSQNANQGSIPSTPTTSAEPSESSRLPLSPDTDDVRLTGVIKDQSTGLLLSEALIRVDTQAAISDGAGFFQIDNLEAEKVILIVQQPGYIPYTATVELKSGRNFHDIDLVPLAQNANQNSPSPSASATPIILEEDGSTPAPTATPNSGESVTPTPTPSPSGPYDPQIDEIALSNVVMRRKENGLELVFLMQRSNSLPVNWEWGSISVEYFLANTTIFAEDTTYFLTSGKTELRQNGDTFVVDPGNRQVGDEIEIDFTLTFPNGRELKQTETVTLSN